jgi:enamine deaminase RidA (YjgF/YER057c/UK114 family)
MPDEIFRKNISTSSSWEPLRGFSRAVVAGERLFVSGTTALNEKGAVVSPNDPYEQTRYILQNFRLILRESGFAFEDIVMTRLFVTKISDWDLYARAHREAFENIRPASSIVEISRLMDPRLVIEMECEAVLGARHSETARIELESD